jgi:hypothetical protein
MPRTRPTHEQFQAVFNDWGTAGVDFWKLAQARLQRQQIDEEQAEVIEQNFESSHQKLMALVRDL